MARFQLNLRKPNNYAFFCPKSRLHLTVSNPVGSASEVTTAILRGIKSGSLIDMDNAVTDVSGQKSEDQPQAVQQAESMPEPVQETEPATQQKAKRSRKDKAVETAETQAAESAE